MSNGPLPGLQPAPLRGAEAGDWMNRFKTTYLNNTSDSIKKHYRLLQPCKNRLRYRYQYNIQLDNISNTFYKRIKDETMYTKTPVHQLKQA